MVNQENQTSLEHTLLIILLKIEPSGLQNPGYIQNMSSYHFGTGPYPQTLREQVHTGQVRTYKPYGKGTYPHIHML